MGLYISPKHVIAGPISILEWDINDKIDLIVSQIDGWYLEIADRVINGWKNPNGEDCINAINRQGGITHMIPDSGWAVLQNGLNYFETIAFFKLGKKTNKKWTVKAAFTWGMNNVFPELNQAPTVIDIIWTDLRNSIYHSGLTNGRVVLRHNALTKPIEEENGAVIIDPHRFIPRLREHLYQYAEQLQNPDEIELRDNFDKAFTIRHK